MLDWNNIFKKSEIAGLSIAGEFEIKGINQFCMSLKKGKFFK
jgi:hypothetical protein